MKKIFYTALAALTLAACTKTEANYSNAEQIIFKPVSKFDTKAAVAGTKFTADQDFYVYANTIEDNKKYFENILFVPENGEEVEVNTQKLQVYKGQPTQYWPNVLSLKFAGHTKTGNLEAAKMSEDFSTMSIKDYRQPSPIEEGNNDLMYFFDNNNGNGYAKGTPFVSPTMKHACSWLTINIEAEQTLVNYWANLKVVDVTLLKLMDFGKAIFPANDATAWKLDTKSAKDTKVFVGSKNISSESPIKVEFANIPNNTIVLPQTPVQLSVTYSYTTPAGIADFTETKVLDLFYDDAKTAWQPGKHYTYNLTLTAEEIKIAPSSTDWTADPTNIEF